MFLSIQALTSKLLDTTPPRIASIHKWNKVLTLEITIFDLKSGLEKIVIKFHEPHQRCLLTYQANSAFLGRFFCTEQQQL